MKLPKPLKIRYAIAMYNYYTECFKDGTRKYDKLSIAEKEFYHACCAITLKEKGIIERPDFLFIE